MAPKIIKGTPEKGFDVTARGRWLLQSSDELTSKDAIVLDQASNVLQSRIYIAGSVSADDDQIAIRLRSEYSQLEIYEVGSVTGRVEIRGNESRLVNAGEMSIADGTLLLLGGTHGLALNTGSMTSDGLVIDLRKATFGEVTNEGGTITSLSGTAILGNDAFRVDNNGGVINAGVTAVQLNTPKNGDSYFSNRATVSAGENAFVGGLGDDYVTNSGTMTGNVMLGAGDDSFAAWVYQHLDGTVYGGRGNDTLMIYTGYTSDGTPSETPTFQLDQFVELDGGGRDTIDTMFDCFLPEHFENINLRGTYDTVAIGNAADNRIFGNGGNNRISGEQGRDTLTGRTGSDTFVFSDGFGVDYVTDFRKDRRVSDSGDRIDLSGLTGIADYDDLLAHHVMQTKAGVMISVDSDRLWLLDYTLNKLDASQIIFADEP